MKGKIALVNRVKKELALCIEEDKKGEAKKTLVFSLEPNVRITDSLDQQIKLINLREGQIAKVGYYSDRNKYTAVYVKVSN